MSLKTYLIILKTGIYLSFVSVFLVFNNLLFPFITSKQLFFNILMEILMVFWLALIIKYPEARPKKSFITWGLAFFFSALLVSSLFGVDFNMSFWGNIERMLGWFHIIHFFLFYLIIITVFREWRDWRNLLIVSVAAAALVCLYGLLKIPYSTIGNTAYVSGYAIFNIYFALILFFRDREKNEPGSWLAGALYLAAAFIMLLVMRVTHTRGAYVGLGASFALFLIMRAGYSPNRKVKIYSFAGLAAIVTLVVLAFSFPQSALVRNSSVLGTITQVSSSATTFQTRLISWKAALKDFPNHPVLGTGYGNYAITFDKYFDPKFYIYTPTETYFDRAHNNLVDIISTTGLAGLLSYLSILGAAGYYLAKGKRQNKISGVEFILLISLFAAYFIQNLAVFDSLITYISLMLALAYIYWLANREPEAAQEEAGANRALNNKELGALVFGGLVLFSIAYQYNIRPWLMLDGTIKGQIEFAKGDIAAAVKQYKKTFATGTVLDRDSRKSMINSLNGQQDSLFKLDRAQAAEIADYAISLAEANVKYNPLDSMMQMQLAQILNTASLINQNNSSKFYFYSDRALKAIDASIKASPGRTTIYFTKAQIYLMRNDKAKALETLKYAVSLNEQYAEASCFLAKAGLYLKEEATGFEAMGKCLDLGGRSYLGPAELVKIALNHYLAKNDQPRILALYQRWVELEPGNAKIWVNLSLLYGQQGDKDKAVEAARKAADLDPSLKSAAEEFIKKQLAK
ncbi:MAG: O-antigen ligase family protein [bacterium]|nr:O-antigen ligase family protein [bacterium]